MHKKPYEVFSNQPEIASKHSVIINNVRYVGFKPKSDSIRSIVFRGVPYANSTEGDNRLIPPTSFVTARDEINCFKYGPACWQSPIGARLFFEGLGVLFKEMIFPSSKPGFSKTYGRFSEDCLNLNIWTPNLDSKKRTVMVWIHGGAFKSGSNIELGLYNGDHLSQKGDIVVVSINYRFGLFAMYLPEEGIANITLQDQIFALKWIQDNIEKFGGDPNNVTIFGESAGAVAINHLLASPEAKGLFHKAISQSGGAASLTQDESQKIIENAKKQFRSKSIRSEISPQDLLKRSDKVESTLSKLGSSKGGFFPVRDGKFVDSEGALKGIEKGNGSNVPLLIGSNAQEMQLFSATFGILFPLNREAVISGLRAKYNLMKNSSEDTSKLIEQADKLIEVFTKILQEKTGKIPKKKKVIEAILTFTEFTSEAYEIAAAQSKVNDGEVYSYLFRYGAEKYGACHALELPFIWNFGSPYEKYFGRQITSISNGSKSQQISMLADQMQQAWINFAKTGKPSAINQQSWESFPSRMNLDLQSYVDNWNDDAGLNAVLNSNP